MDKKKRQELILRVIRLKEINTQEEMLDALNIEGLKVTQATVSRDIKELGLIKTGGRIKKYMYASSPEEDTAVSRVKLFKSAVVSVVQAQNIVVVKTLPGNGSAVAAILDTAEIDEIVGTIAGDDTVFVVAKDNNAAETVTLRINGLI